MFCAGVRAELVSCSVQVYVLSECHVCAGVRAELVSCYVQVYMLS